MLADRVLKNKGKGLCKLQVLNLETNVLNKPGTGTLSEVIADDKVWRYLQVLKLENQKAPLHSSREEKLARAIGSSPSIVVCSLRVRGGTERQLINSTVAANIDTLRLARRQHAAKTGTLKEGKRNEMEEYFYKIAGNDASITKIDMVGNIKFSAVSSAEKTKAGAALATNTHVQTIQMVKLQLYDDFARAMGKSLEAIQQLKNLYWIATPFRMSD